jgi:hypothetical protein
VRADPADSASLGVSSIIEFIDQRRAEGWTWQQLAAASGQPQTWLRRHAAAQKQQLVS